MSETPHLLKRELGTPGAVMLGLGSIVGTGVYVSLGLAAGVAGNAVLGAILLAAAVATCNGLSSAQLAAAYPVSGGTYEYGHRVLNHRLGFAAGWMFLCAKTASAATAALGLGGYLARLVPAGLAPDAVEIVLALLAAGLLTMLTAGGLRRTSAFNIVVVSATLAALAYFCITGALVPPRAADAGHVPKIDATLAGFLEAAALVFVAFTGYGRVATLGEEVRTPRKTIPRAIIAVLVVSMLLYVAVAAIALRHHDAAAYAALARGNDAPLAVIAGDWDTPGGGLILTLGAATALVGVLLNLILGLSRVVLAMARRGDLPRRLAQVGGRHQQPVAAVVITGVAIAAFAMVRDVRVTWSFSAFAVLVYYAITNLCVLRLARERRLYPRPIAAVGLGACLCLAFWVDAKIWIAGLALLGAGLLWHEAAFRLGRARRDGERGPDLRA